MNDTTQPAELPALPDPHWPIGYFGGVPSGGFTKDQMHEYARAALAAQAAPAVPEGQAERFADLRHYLNEAHQFAAMSPRGRDCIGIALDILDEAEAAALAAAPTPAAQETKD